MTSLHSEAVIIQQQSQMMAPKAINTSNALKEYNQEIVEEAEEIKKQLTLTMDVVESINTQIHKTGVEQFDVGSFGFADVQRRLSPGASEPILLCPRPVDEAVGCRDHMGSPSMRQSPGLNAARSASAFEQAP